MKYIIHIGAFACFAIVTWTQWQQGNINYNLQTQLNEQATAIHYFKKDFNRHEEEVSEAYEYMAQDLFKLDLIVRQLVLDRLRQEKENNNEN